MGKTEHRISYKAGVTRTPSDFLCAEGELAECINMASDHEELKTVPPLEGLFTFPAVPDHGESAQAPYITRITRKLLYVHKYNNQERYVIWQQTEWSGGKATERDIRWGTVEDGQYVPAQEYFPPSTIGDIILPGFYEDYVLFDDPGTATVTCIGKTLVFNTEEGLKYAIWNSDGYKVMDKIPELQFTAHIKSNGYIESSGSYDTFLEFNIEQPYFVVKSESQHAYNDLVYGLLAENKKKAAQAHGFTEPFFVMAALQLYDESYTMMTAPILLTPSVTQHSYVRIKRAYPMPGGFYPATEYLMYMVTHYGQLWCRQLTDYSEWSDIVKEVVIFVTDGISFYETDVDAVGSGTVTDGNWTAISDSYLNLYDLLYDSIFKSYSYESVSIDNYHNYFMARALRKRHDQDISDDITSMQPFYKLCKLGIKPFGTAADEANVSRQFGIHTLENITTQDQLKTMEYFSHCSMQAEMFYAYNSRLNIAGIKRGFFEGYDYFFPWENPEEGQYTAFVRINSDSGNRIVKKEWTAKQKQGIWFYYPDPRAEWVTIYKKYDNGGIYGQIPVLNTKLTEHPGLNGAYYFWGMSQTFDETPPVTVLLQNYVEGQYVDTTNAIPYDTPTNVTPEYLPNKIATSEVNNPFVFLAKGYNTVGTGRIIGMATQTHPLSPGQYGYAPLIVFTDEGLWAMSVDRTGLYNNVDPMPREVCVNPRSIIQTDDSVLFVSKKGLMVIKGRDVSCVSTLMDGRGFDTQLVDCLTAEALGSDVNSEAWAQVVGSAADDGMSFQTFLSEALVAYDYIDRRVLLLHPSMPYCWSWSMRDGGFTKLILPARITNVVGNYPDYILQDADVNGRTYAFYGKTREEDVSERQRGFLLTRPLKLSGPVGVSSLRELLNVGCWDKEGGSAVKSQVLVSDDLHRWYVAGSRFGAATKYFRIALFVYMLPSERLSGTIVREQERRSDNARG